MSDLFEPNPERATVDWSQAATGPRVGFMDAWHNSQEQQYRASSLLAVQSALSDVWDRQSRQLMDRGEQNIPPLLGMSGDDLSSFYEDGGTPEQAATLRRYDEGVKALNDKYPGLGMLDSRGMWDHVKSRAQSAEQRASGMRTTTGGTIGSFLGGAVAGIDPRTDPLNFFTLPVGGFGKSALLRVATEAGAQGAVEAVNQVTGVQDQRRRLGLEYGWKDAASRVGMAAAGGAVFQGLGEGVSYAARRWFVSTPKDIAPPPPEPAASRLDNPKLDPDVRDLVTGRVDYTALAAKDSPLSPSRIGAARAIDDIEHVTRRLEAWDGEAPTSILPRTVQDAMGHTDRGIDIGPQAREAATAASIDGIARQLDPKTFSVYDKLADRVVSLRRSIELSGPDEAGRLLTTREMDDQIHEITQRLRQPDPKTGRPISARTRRTLEAERDALKGQRDKALGEYNKGNSYNVRALREELMKADEQMRDLAPAVSRAYSHARGRWDADAPQREALRQMMRDGGKTMPNKPIFNSVDEAMVMLKRTLADDAPILRDSYKVEGQMRENADGIDYAKAITAKAHEVSSETVEAMRGSLASTIKKEGEEAYYNVPGTDQRLHLDKDTIEVPQERGNGTETVTVREYLQRQLDAEEDAQAITSCRI